MLIIFAGLPGVGKTTLAKAVAQRIGACYLRIDSIEEALATSTLNIHPAEDAGYQIGFAVAEDNLRIGQTVVADSVNPIDLSRSSWLAVAERAECKAVEIEVICSDQDEHRRRVEQRRADFPAQRWPDWQAVIDRDYQPWTRDRLVIDTATASIDENVEKIIRKLSAKHA